MKGFRLVLVLFLFLYFLAIGVYFLSFYDGEWHYFSYRNEDWANFGSFIGGVLSPASALLAGYLVFKTFSENTHQQKILIVRESIQRLDKSIDEKIDQSFMNNCFGEQYVGKSMRNIIILVSNNDIQCNDEFREAVTSLAFSLAALCVALVEYKKMLHILPAGKVGDEWLWNVEQHYWIEKYGPVYSRMERVAGEDMLCEKLGAMRYECLKFVICGVRK
ncbi:MAG: hypothetical protein GYB17_15070 [Gammaproteobacteria bacterium]|nr:hypothetical protein [Gammaproteobacteria bacterium]